MKWPVRIRCCYVLLGWWLLAHPAAALPPEHEMSRLLLAVEQAVSAQDWTRASSYLALIDGLQTTQPPETDYFRGRVALALSDNATARQALERYVVAAGTEGRYYRESLQMITQAEERAATPSVSAEPPAEALKIESAAAADIKALQKLYLSATPRAALLEHLNQLLAVHAWQGQRIRKAEQDSGIRYQVSVSATGRVQFTIRDYRQPDAGGPAVGAVRTAVTELDVFGVNPILRQDCDATQWRCWIVDPRDDYTPWLIIDHDPAAAADISRTLGLLIRELQGQL